MMMIYSLMILPIKLKKNNNNNNNSDIPCHGFPLKCLEEKYLFIILTVAKKGWVETRCSICPKESERSFSQCTWRHHFLKSKTKEPPKLLSSSGMRGGKFIFVNNFSAQECASSKNRNILNFRVVAVRDIKLRTCLSKNIYTSLGT